MNKVYYEDDIYYDAVYNYLWTPLKEVIGIKNWESEEYDLAKNAMDRETADHETCIIASQVLNE